MMATSGMQTRQNLWGLDGQFPLRLVQLAVARDAVAQIRMDEHTGPTAGTGTFEELDGTRGK